MMAEMLVLREGLADKRVAVSLGRTGDHLFNGFHALA